MVSGLSPFRAILIIPTLGKERVLCYYRILKVWILTSFSGCPQSAYYACYCSSFFTCGHKSRGDTSLLAIMLPVLEMLRFFMPSFLRWHCRYCRRLPQATLPQSTSSMHVPRSSFRLLRFYKSLHTISTSWSHNTHPSYPRTFIGRPSMDPASKFRPVWNTTRGSYSAHLDSSSWHVGGSYSRIIPPPLCSLVPNCLLSYVLCGIYCHPCIVRAGGDLGTTTH